MKSGASFNKGRVEKIDKLFKKINEPAKSQKNSGQKAEISMEDDTVLAKFDKEIEANKTATKAAQDVSDMTLLKTLQKEFVTISNRRKEALIQLQRQNKIVLEGANVDSVPELAPTWARMVSKYNLGKPFMQGINQGGYTTPTPV